MATIGQQLTSPEAGWQRIDDNSSYIVYSGGSWVLTTTDSNEYNTTQHQDNAGMGIVSFSFVGTKLRIIGYVQNNRPNFDVNIDGTIYSFTEYSSSVMYQSLVGEITGLANKQHSVKISTKTTSDKYFALDAIDIDSTGYMVASVGCQLTTPESTWKRYDDTDSRLFFTGTWGSTSSSSPSYNSTNRWTSDGTVSFKFYGTKIRIVSTMNSNRDITRITIDGTAYTYSEYTSGSQLYQILLFEKTNLPLQLHSVLISKDNTSGSYQIAMDAIDVDDTGELRDYNNPYYPYFLVQNGTEVFTVKPNTYVSLGNITPTLQQFKDYGNGDLSQVMTTISTNSSPLVNKGALDVGTVYKSLDIDKADINGLPFFDDTTVINTVKYNLNTPFKPYDKLGNNFDVLLYRY